MLRKDQKRTFASAILENFVPNPWTYPFGKIEDGSDERDGSLNGSLLQIPLVDFNHFFRITSNLRPLQIAVLKNYNFLLSQHFFSKS